jgi:hypothetical protein
MLRDKTHLIANDQLVEATILDAVPVEVYFSTVRARDKAAVSFGQETRNPSVVGHRVQLHVAAPFASVIFEQPAGRVKSITNRNVGIFMCVVSLGIAADDDLFSRNLEVDAHSKQIALLPTGVAAFDDHPARNNPIKKVFKLLGALAYPRRDRVRSLHVAEGDLKGELHRIFL